MHALSSKGILGGHGSARTQRRKRLRSATTVHQPTQTAQPTMRTHSPPQPHLKTLRRPLLSTHIYHTVHCAYMPLLLRAYFLNNTARDTNAKYDYTRWRKNHRPQTEQPTSLTQARPLPPLERRRIATHHANLPSITLCIHAFTSNGILAGQSSTPA